MKGIRFSLIPVLAVLGGLPSVAHAFPEMVRHGYGACVACHVSNDGGGVLTPYGREVSGIALSMWGGRNESVWGNKAGEYRESYFIYRAVETPDWLQMGGDFRYNQLRYHMPDGSAVNRSIFMQADLEAAATFKRVTIDGTFGRDDHDGALFSRRHFLRLNLTDRLNVRLGKFFLAYGIHTPDHALSIKRGIGWDEGTESYNLEFSKIEPGWDVFLTGILRRPEVPGEINEEGAALRGSVFLKEKYKIGASVFVGSTASASRTVAGPYALLGFTHQLTMLTEFDFQKQNPKVVGSDIPGWGVFTYNKLDYEPIQGLHAFVTHEMNRENFSSSSGMKETYGVGLQFFPRPHFEIQGSYKKDFYGSGASRINSDYMYLVTHFYP